MSRLRARCPRCRTLTAVALGEGYECHSCGTAYGAGLVRVPSAWGRGGARMAAAATLDLPYPEVARVAAGSLAEQNLELAASLPVRPLVLGGCCCAHVGAVEGLASSFSRLGLVWLDAHGDLNTPLTSPSGNAWGMPLRTLVDDGAVALERVVLIGARNLDPGEEEFVAKTGLACRAEQLEEVLSDAEAVYVALDADVLDPGQGVSAFMPEPGGPSLDDVEQILARLKALLPVAGAGFTGLEADERNVAPLTRLAAALGL